MFLLGLDPGMSLIFIGYSSLVLGCRVELVADDVPEFFFEKCPMRWPWPSCSSHIVPPPCLGIQWRCISAFTYL